MMTPPHCTHVTNLPSHARAAPAGRAPPSPTPPPASSCHDHLRHHQN